jgi:hypothetical protein
MLVPQNRMRESAEGVETAGTRRGRTGATMAKTRLRSSGVGVTPSYGVRGGGSRAQRGRVGVWVGQSAR